MIAYYAMTRGAHRTVASISIRPGKTGDESVRAAELSRIKTAVEQQQGTTSRNTAQSFAIEPLGVTGTKLSYEHAQAKQAASTSVYLFASGDWFVQLQSTVSSTADREALDTFVRAQRWKTLGKVEQPGALGANAD